MNIQQEQLTLLSLSTSGDLTFSIPFFRGLLFFHSSASRDEFLIHYALWPTLRQLSTTRPLRINKSAQNTRGTYLKIEQPTAVRRSRKIYSKSETLTKFVYCIESIGRGTEIDLLPSIQHKLARSNHYICCGA